MMMRRLNVRSPIFEIAPSECIDEQGPLTHEQIARSKHRGAGLLLLALDCYEPHVRALRRLADRLRIGGIFLSF